MDGENYKLLNPRNVERKIIKYVNNGGILPMNKEFFETHDVSPPVRPNFPEDFVPIEKIISEGVRRLADIENLLSDYIE